MKHITIIGGGIGGLCLAQGLAKENIDFEVYEKNTSTESWLEGYRIHIRPVGANALFECLPEATWNKFISSTGQPTDGFGFLTEDLKELVHIDEELMIGGDPLPEHGQYNVSRRQLREALTSDISDRIHYGKEFKEFMLLENDRIMVFFEDGTSIETDLLVGADGSNSRVRKQLLPNAKRVNTNAVAIGGKMFLTGERQKWLPHMLSSRMNVVIPRNRYFFFNAVYRRQEENYILWSFVAHKHEFDGTPARGALKVVVIDKIRKWHPAFMQLVLESDDESLLWLPLKTMLPVAPWISSPVTLLGDAIHNMTPLQGMGANMALFDAAVLLAEINKVIREEKSLVTGVSEYEKIMLEKGFEAVRTSLKYTDQAISYNRISRFTSRTWFRICNAAPFIKRLTFKNKWKGLGTQAQSHFLFKRRCNNVPIK